MKCAHKLRFLVVLCSVFTAFGLPCSAHASGFAYELPAGIEAPNRFGLDGDASFLNAGVAPVDVPKRKHVVEIDAPGALDQPHTEYRLVKDVVADGTAFQIKANHITLNLGGHTVVYGNRAGAKKAMGVHLVGRWSFEDVAIFNGKIVQGSGGYNGADGKVWGSPYGSDACLIQGFSITGIEIGGLHLVYNGDDSSGIYLKAKNVRIHHNTIEDKGGLVENRHAGVAVVNIPGGQAKVHHNLILGARHNGIRLGKNCEVYDNEVVVDSRATNSAGIAAGGKVYRNKVTGRGEHPLGFYVAGNIIGDGMELYENYVDVKNTRGSGEYDSPGSACLRMQWGDNVVIRDNTFILHAEKGGMDNGGDSWGRGLFISISEEGRAALVRHNLIVALSKGQGVKAAAIAVVANNQSSNLIFQENIVVSDWSNVLLADKYGHADGHPQFIDNRFVRFGGWDGYRTIRSEYSSRPSTGVFINSTFENGASLSNIDLECFGSGNKEIRVGWHLDLNVRDLQGRPVEGAQVAVKDVHGDVAAKGQTDSGGRLRLNLVQYCIVNQSGSMVVKAVNSILGKACSRIQKTPHEVVVTKGDSQIRREVVMDGNQSLQLIISGDAS